MNSQSINMRLHVEGVQDIVRDKSLCSSYMNAIVGCPYLFKGKTVLSLYNGHGFLTLLCCQAGAQHVINICESQQEMELTKMLIKENGFNSRVSFKMGPITQCNLDTKVDVIVSIPFGYCFYFDNRVQKLIFARDKFLKEDGIMFPDKVVIRAAMIQDSYYYDKKILFWQDVYGIDMTPVIKWVMTEPILDVVDPSVIPTTIALLKTINLYSIKSEQLDFVTTYKLTTREDSAVVHGMIIWFDAHFTHGPTETILSTSPFSARTKFKQSIFYLQKEMPLSQGDIITGSIAIKRAPFKTNFKISYHSKDQDLTQQYFLT